MLLSARKKSRLIVHQLTTLLLLVIPVYTYVTLIQSRIGVCISGIDNNCPQSADNLSRSFTVLWKHELCT